MVDWLALLAIVVGGIVVLCLPLIVYMVWRRSPWQQVLGAVLGAPIGAVLVTAVLFAILFFTMPGAAAQGGMSLAANVMLFGGITGGALGAYLGTRAAGAIRRRRVPP